MLKVLVSWFNVEKHSLHNSCAFSPRNPYRAYSHLLWKREIDSLPALCERVMNVVGVKDKSIFSKSFEVFKYLKPQNYKKK